MTKLSLNDELNRQIKEELKGLEPNKQQEIMMQQKYGLLRPLLTEEELAICTVPAIRPEVLEAFEQSVARNHELLKLLARKDKYDRYSN